MSIQVLSPGGPTGLSERPPLPAGILERGNPRITGHTYYSDRGISCVVWGATPYRILPKQRPDFEFSILLEGEVVLTDGNGHDHVVRTGDAFVLPPAFDYQWGQEVPVLKFALSFTPAQPAQAGSVFTPIRLASHSKPDWNGSGRTLFEEPTGCFRVVGYELASNEEVQIGAGDSLVKVLTGSITVRDDSGDSVSLQAGQVAFMSIANPVVMAASASTLLLACTVSSAN